MGAVRAKSKAKTVKVSRADFEEACESYAGFCLACKDFTTGCCEPDAEGYPCEACGAESVVGAEQALLLGKITF